MSKNILVTGGAGYIGSFMVQKLGSAGFRPIVIDNLSNGRKDAVLYGEFIEGDTGDASLLEQIITRHQIKTVFHFAAYASVKESIEHPDMYMDNNYEKSRVLFRICREHSVEHIIYSSSCAVYGIPPRIPVDENCPLRPISPYGESKKQAEKALMEICRDSSMTYSILRYFNVAGADIHSGLGEVFTRNGRLFKFVAEAAAGKRDSISIFGTNYNTPDRTAIRDYIHVRDLVDVHWQLWNYLKNGGGSDVFNVGYGTGYSVKEIIDTFQLAANKTLNVIHAEPRPGDPPHLVADASKLVKTIGWKPSFNDIGKIAESTLQWEQRPAK